MVFDKTLKSAIDRGFLITKNRRLKDEYYLYCESHARACLTVWVYRNKCNVWLNMFPSEYDICEEGRQKAESLFDWYFACAWHKIKPRQRIYLGIGPVDISIDGIPVEDGQHLACELLKICRASSISRYERWMDLK
jgi:hypothetical protein